MRSCKHRMLNKFVQLLFFGMEHFYESLTNLQVFESEFIDITSVSFSVQS